MIPLSRATRGRIRIGTSKKILVLAVAGMLYFSIPSEVIGSKGGGNIEAQIPYTENLHKKLLLAEDEEILEIVKAFMKWQ